MGVWALYNFLSHTETQLTNVFKVYEEPEEIAAEEEEPAPVVEEEEPEAPPPPTAGISQVLLHRQESVVAWLLHVLHTIRQYPSSIILCKICQCWPNKNKGKRGGKKALFSLIKLRIL